MCLEIPSGIIELQRRLAMKINHIIREKRKELSLTQEQVAEFLGVSTPAVNKWEKGGSYPDITLLPALARLLKTDLNTLLSFQDDLSDVEIVNFVDELDKIVQENGYEIAFQMAIDKIHDFPTCENLIYSAVMYLTGALILYNVSESEQYQKVFEAFYEQLSHSQNTEIKEMAISMLISYSLNRKDFSKAEELINTLPSSSIDQEERLAFLYTKQEKHLDALKSTLAAMHEKWNPKESPLYKHLNSSGTSVFSERLLAMLQNEMENGNEFAFLESNQKYQQLLKEIRNHNNME